MGIAEKIKRIYAKNYKKLIIIPLIILFCALLVFAVNYYNSGEAMKKDISLTGGVSATIYTQQDFPDIYNLLVQKFPYAEFTVRELREFGSGEQIGVLIESTSISNEELKGALQEITGIELTPENYSSETVGSSLGREFYKQMIIAIAIAFALMMVVILITFRTVLPSLIVVFCAFCDMAVALALWSLLGYKLSTSIIAAALLLIGYSIDTDILLTTRMLKRKEGSILDRLFSSIKTGMTMTLTTLAALIAGYLIIASTVLKGMFLVMIFGLCADIIFTYLFNASILLWYRHKKERFTEPEPAEPIKGEGS